MMITITVKTLTNKSVHIEIEPTATIEELKEAFHDIEGTPVDQQKIIFAGNRIADNITLRDAGIENGATVHMVLRPARVAPDQIRVQIKTIADRVTHVAIACNATVAQLKQEYAAASGVLVAAQRLIFAGKELKDERTLSDYNIINDAQIHVVLRYVPPPVVTVVERDEPAPPKRFVYLLCGAGIGAGFGALTGTAIAAALDYFTQGTAEQLGMVFGIPIPVGALIGTFVGELVFRDAVADYRPSITLV